MGLDQDLCRMAQDLYRWDISFEGDLIEAPRATRDDEWIVARAFPQIGIASHLLEGRTTYGFAERKARTDFQAYLPVAMVYRGREHDYQGDFLSAALLHLRKRVSHKPLNVTFPTFLARHLQPYHISLLDGDNEEVTAFPGELVRIFREDDLSARREVVESWRIRSELLPRQ